MTREEIIQGLKFTVDMFLLDPTTGETYTEPRNDMDKTTIDACRGAILLLEQEPCDDCISRQAAQAKIKNICDEYRLSYEDGERKAATGGSAYALGHAFDDLPPVTPQPETYTNIPLLLHKEFGCPLDECVKAYEEAIEHLRSKSKLKG